ncbi:MAG: phosphoribosyl-ATP diphosphatase [Clostridiales bacterium]|nr:phosphoribosyl-ATP diphosphatase [Clostridiales bacterium]
MEKEMGLVIRELYQLILQRKAELPEGSYTTYLFQKGQDKILKKVGEEAAEVIIASKNKAGSEIVYESADLLYHLLVLWASHGIDPQAVAEELSSRRK